MVVEPTAQVDAADKALKMMKRRWKAADVSLLFREGDREWEHGDALFSIGRSIEAWDARSVSMTPVDSRCGGGLS